MVIENTRVMKILMDGGSDINILYKDAFDKLNADIRKLHASQSPFHGIIPGWRVMPLGIIDLSMTFGDAVHYQKETLSFEVVNFQGPYSAIFGRSCYTKFITVPNYAYLKLKMPGPCGIITVSGNFQSIYQCERDAVEYTEAKNLDSMASSLPCSRLGKKLLSTTLGQ
ncbi:uncharacterized protein [Miscanthus floridulus]|uniref:uncharacterized protein n=1 Tax=Miscanthus floridulus TaxID=154761 RepID=UPI003458CD36